MSDKKGGNRVEIAPETGGNSLEIAMSYFHLEKRKMEIAIAVSTLFPPLFPRRKSVISRL